MNERSIILLIIQTRLTSSQRATHFLGHVMTSCGTAHESDSITVKNRAILRPLLIIFSLRAGLSVYMINSVCEIMYQ